MANTAGPFGKRDREGELTTARILGAYRRELKDEGFDPEAVYTLTIEAARQLLRDEPLVVGTEIPEGMTLLHVAIPVDESLVKDKRAVERVASEAALRAVEAVLSRD